MHTKEKGNIAELFIAQDLIKKGCAVFGEYGDLSRIDLIAVYNNRCIKIQVKLRTTDKEEGKFIRVERKKNGPGYSYKYQENDVDIFAVYVPDKNEVLYIPMTKLLDYESCITIRFEKEDSKYQNGKSFHYYDEYLSFEKSIGLVV